MTFFQKIFLSCLFFMLVVTTSAMASNEPSILRVKLGNGSISYFELSVKPVISFSTDSIIISSSIFRTAMYTYGSIQNISFVDDIETAINNIPSRRVFQFHFIDGVHVGVSGMNSSDKIFVYSSDGMLVSPEIRRNVEYAIIDLSSQVSGLYIVKVGNQSYKIFKK